MRRPRSLRARLALAVGGIGLVLLGVTGYIVVRTLDGAMYAEARRQVERSLRVLMEVQSSAELPATVKDVAFVEVTEGSSGAALRDPIFADIDVSAVEAGKSATIRRTVDGRPYYIGVARASDESFTAGVAVPLTAVEQALATLRWSIFVTVLGLAIMLAVIAAIVTGRALRPVATMRAEADAISHGTLDRRLPDETSASELSDLSSTINRMLNRIESAARAQRRFSSDASHELRSPLATVRAQLELAIAAPSTLEDRGPSMLADIDRLDLIVGDLLAVSRADVRDVATLPVDLDELVLDHVERLQRGDLAIEVRGVDHVQVVGDEKLLTSLVRNLLDNAARHARQAVRLRLSEDGDGSAHFIVDDDGPGIPLDQRSAVFERFTRLDDGRDRDSGGTGLGLAVAMAAARAHGGTIEIADSPLGGARFMVVLRAARGTAP